MQLTFPLKTCEEKQDIIAQPFSALINFMNACVLLYFTCVSKTLRSKLLIGAVFVFELFHAFSHAVHVSAKFQTITVHALTYLVNAAFLFFVYDATKTPPPILLRATLLGLAALDIYCLFHLPLITYISTQICMLVATSFFYFRYLPEKLKNGLIVLAGFAFIIMGFFYNETVNCESMMKTAVFPYHAVVEILLFVLFFTFAQLFTS